MSRTVKAVIVALGLLAAPVVAQAQDLTGVWRNPKNTVHVQVAPCGDGACGRVVWASPKAEAAARKGGTAELVGLELFRGFVQDGEGAWKGQVFVPDLNRTFTGKAESIDAASFRARGCLVAGVLCKTQVWIRVDQSISVASR